MGRIASLFNKVKAENRSAFIAYICAGDPDPDTSYRLAEELIQSGVDILELGVPFSDPLADGLTNQLAAQRALDAGVGPDAVFGLVEKLRENYDTPIVFYTYYNLVFSQGVQAYVERAKGVGVDGILVLDLPPEEAEEMEAVNKALGMDSILIIAPTTRDDRIQSIVSHASGFIYYVSREGVTGERDAMASGMAEAIGRIRAHTDLPVAVGFGISKPEHVKAVGAIADGVIVGSSLVRCIEENAEQPDEAVSALGERARWLISGLESRG